MEITATEYEAIKDYLYKNTLEPGKFEPMKCAAKVEVFFVCGKKKPGLMIEFCSEDVQYIVSTRIFLKKGFNETPYAAEIITDDNSIITSLESGNCYIFEFTVKYPSGARETIKRTYDLRGETVKFDEISIDLFGNEAARLKGDPLLKEAAIKMRGLNRLLPQGTAVGTMQVFSTIPGTIGSKAIMPSREILPVLHTVFTSFKTVDENKKAVIDAITHEYGHQLNQLTPADPNVDFDALFTRANKEAVIGIFCDGSYSADEQLGHPWDDPSELFASAFTVLTNYPVEFRDRLKNDPFSEEQKALITKLANYVYSRCYGRPFFN